MTAGARFWVVAGICCAVTPAWPLGLVCAVLAFAQ
jgi:hypothetical protein